MNGQAYNNFSILEQVGTKTITSEEYANLPASEKQKKILYYVTDDTSDATLATSDSVLALQSEVDAKQAKITASGILQGDGSGGVTAKTLDTSSLTNDNDHIPTSGIVKSALDAVLPSVTSSDNGKVLRVVNGAWAAASLPVYNGGVS